MFKKWKKWQKIASLVVAAILLVILVSGLVIKSLSPDNIAYPVSDHYHFRMQYVIDGKAEDFGQDKYQLNYKKGICGSPLTEEPIHFHDFRDQVVHIHWTGMTGGQVLKNYGLNLIGGPDNLLGYRLDTLRKFPPEIRQVTIFKQVLPKLADNQELWIYTGDKSESGEVSYRKRDFEAFLWADLESFFGKESLIKEQQRKASEADQTINYLPFQLPFGSINAQAHAGEDHAEDIGKPLLEVEQAQNNKSENPTQTQQSTSSSSPSSGTEVPTKFELETINNLLGNVVIFAQKDEPTDAQIKERFNNLIQLEDSTCGG